MLEHRSLPIFDEDTVAEYIHNRWNTPLEAINRYLTQWAENDSYNFWYVDGIENDLLDTIDQIEHCEDDEAEYERDLWNRRVVIEHMKTMVEEGLLPEEFLLNVSW